MISKADKWYECLKTMAIGAVACFVLVGSMALAKPNLPLEEALLKPIISQNTMEAAKVIYSNTRYFVLETNQGIFVLQKPHNITDLERNKLLP